MTNGANMIGLTVCVNYAAELAVTLPVWRDSLESLVVVTIADDRDTMQLCLRAGVGVYRTDAFTRDGAAFNKGRAMNEAIGSMLTRPQWLCVFDADILPPADWRAATAGIEAGNLYGAARWQDGITPISDPPDEMPGFFWLFHTRDLHLPRDPTFTSWQHAGNFDTVFKDHWPPANRIKLSIRLNHLGQPGQHWHGRGNRQKMLDMYAERERRGGDWRHEAI